MYRKDEGGRRTNISYRHGSRLYRTCPRQQHLNIYFNIEHCNYTQCGAVHQHHTRPNHPLTLSFHPQPQVPFLFAAGTSLAAHLRRWASYPSASHALLGRSPPLFAAPPPRPPPPLSRAPAQFSPLRSSWPRAISSTRSSLRISRRHLCTARFEPPSWLFKSPARLTPHSRSRSHTPRPRLTLAGARSLRSPLASRV